MDHRDLIVRALAEANELGPEPGDAAARWRWDEEWRGAVQLLGALGEHDEGGLGRAALALAGVPGWAAGFARCLLLDAADRSRGGRSAP